MIRLLAPVEWPKISQSFYGNFIYKGKWAYIRNGKKDYHRAFDYKNSNGLTKGGGIYASYDGEVTSISGTYGITIKHVINGETYWTIYWHCLKILVKKGDKVKMGQKIGLIGGDPTDSIPDGGITTSSHVHWRLTKGEVYDAMKAIDISDTKNGIEMINYHDLYPNIPEYARESWARAFINGYAPKTSDEEINMLQFQQILKNSSTIKEVGSMPAYRALVLIDKIKGLIQ